MKNYQTKDSGERIDYESGFRRDINKNKPRYDLIPPELLYRLAMVYTRGAEKYGDEIILPITISNVYDIIGRICNKQKNNTPKKQPATPNQDMLQRDCVFNAMLLNTPKQNEPSATLIELDTLEDCVEYVTTQFLNLKTQNITNDKEKTIKNGLKQTIKDCKNTCTITCEEMTSNVGITVENVNDIFLGLASPGKMNIIYNKNKGKYVLYASIYPHVPTLISTTTTIHKKSGGFYAEDVIKDLDYLATISKVLKEHLNILQIHQSIAFSYENRKFLFTPGFLQNWQLANSEEEYRRFIQSAFRHFEQWRMGQEDEDHAMQCVWNIIAYEWHVNHKSQ